MFKKFSVFLLICVVLSPFNAFACDLFYNQYIFVKFQPNHCPSGYCQLVYYRKMDAQNYNENSGYEIFVTNNEVSFVPDNLEAYQIQLPERKFTQIVARSGTSNISFYKLNDDITINIDEPFVEQIAQYESDPLDPYGIGYPVQAN